MRPLDQVMGERVRSRLALLLAAVGLVLLVACVNVANLNLTRLAAREREIAVRQAIGGTRARVARQLVVEQLAVASAGATLGVALAWVGTPLLVRWLPPDTPRLDHVTVDARVLAFTAGVALLAAFLTALGPLVRLPGIGQAETLGGSGRGTSAGPGRGRLSAILVVTEVALAVMLVVGAGLLLRSLRELLAVDPGVTVERLVTARITPDPIRCGTDVAACSAFYETVGARIAAIPGVSAVAFGNTVPLDGRQFGYVMEVEDNPVPPGSPAHQINTHVVSPNYFPVLGIAVEAGRGLAAEDRADHGPVVVVNRALARHFWPAGSAIGKRIRPLWVQRWSTIVGIVSDVRYDGLGQEKSSYDFYLPAAQWPAGAMTAVVRSPLGPAALEPLVERAVAAVDPTAPVNQIQSMGEIVQRSVASPRTTTALIGLFAGVALALGSIGVYGVLSYGVSRRRREIGIRMAIGAAPAAVMMMVVKRAAGLVAAGVLLGLSAAWLGASLLRGFVFGVGVRDPVTYAAVPMIFGLVGLIAAYVPARRAGRVSPTETLKEG